MLTVHLHYLVPFGALADHIKKHEPFIHPTTTRFKIQYSRFHHIFMLIEQEIKRNKASKNVATRKYNNR